MNAYLKEIAEVCGISLNLISHIARHTFATIVTLNNNVSIESVSKMLGHSSISRHAVTLYTIMFAKHKKVQMSLKTPIDMNITA